MDYYIALAGVDGSGKSYIVDKLRSKGIATIAEPFRKDLTTKALTKRVLEDDSLHPVVRFSLFNANRALGWSSVKEQRLVADRSYICSIVYTIADIILTQTREPFSDDLVYALTADLLKQVEALKVVPTVINKVYLLDPSDSLLYERHMSRGKDKDIIEAKGLPYFTLIKKLYKLIVDHLYTLGKVKAYEIIEINTQEDAVLKSEELIHNIEKALTN